MTHSKTQTPGGLSDSSLLTLMSKIRPLGSIVKELTRCFSVRAQLT